MPTEDSIVERDGGAGWMLANIFLVLVIFFMILCEANAIRGLWFKEAAHDLGMLRYSLPVFIVFPALFLSTFRLGARRWVRKGQMASDLAVRLVSNFGIATIITYICILELAELAFSAR